MATLVNDSVFYNRDKQECRKIIFPSKKEYYHFLDMFLACKDILHAPLEFLHPATIKFRDVYKREILSNISAYPGWRAKFGCLLPMEQIKNNSAFQQKFQEHTEFLADIMRPCDRNFHPAEKELYDDEICFVLRTHPELGDRIGDQSRSVQEILVTKRKAQLLAWPHKIFAKTMTPNQVQSVPFNKRDIEFEVIAVAHNKLPIRNIHLKELPQFVNERLSAVLIDSYYEKLLQEIETLGVPVFGKSVMEQMRLSFIEKDTWDFRPEIDGFMTVNVHSKPLVAYMKNPSKKVKEASVKKNPYAIGCIKYQYDAIQELALRTMAEKRAAYSKRCSVQNNPWNLQMLRLLLAKPSVQIEKLYMDLVR